MRTKIDRLSTNREGSALLLDDYMSTVENAQFDEQVCLVHQT